MDNKRYVVWNYISEADLELLSEWRANIPEEKPQLFARMLFLLGADPNQKWDESFCKHRTRVTGEIVEARRFAFKERTDREWLNSGLASNEAIMCRYQ